MSDQELLDRIAQGDQTALTELCDSHVELIRKRAQWIARQYNCLRPGSRGGWSDYTKETLSELESVGILVLIECARNGGYDSTKGTFGTYIVPFLDGAMRRHLESSMGTLSLDRDSMGLVRKAQMLYYRDGKEISKIAEELDELKVAVLNGGEGETKEELGDLLFSVVNLARFLEVNAEEALAASTEKFIARFRKVEETVNARGEDMSALPLDELMALWNNAKEQLR